MRRLNGVDALLLYSEAPEIHMHTLKIGILDVSGLDGGVHLRAVPPRRRAAVARTEAAALPTGRHPVEAAPPDVGRERRHRLRLPPAAGVGARAGRTPRTRPAHRRDRQHAAGPQPSAVGDVRRRGPRRRPGRGHPQGAPRAGRRRRVGEPDGAGPSSRSRPSSRRRRIRTADSERTDGRAAQGRGPRPRPADPAAAQARRRDRAGRVARPSAGHGSAARTPSSRRNFAPPPTFINHVVSPVRRFATAPLALADVKETAKALGVTINDVVLATVAGRAARAAAALRRGRGLAADRRGARQLRHIPDRLVGNEFTYMTPSLAVHVDDPIERVRLTATSTRDRQGEPPPARSDVWSPTWLNYLPPSMAPPAFRWQSKRMESSMIMNLTVSNVPGPRERGTFGGAVISEIYSVGPAGGRQRHEHHGVELRRPAEHLGADRRSDDRGPARGDRRDDPVVRRDPQGCRAVPTCSPTWAASCRWRVRPG